jgi:TonB-linked SusC/RagA family outer membrane protein
MKNKFYKHLLLFQHWRFIALFVTGTIVFHDVNAGDKKPAKNLLYSAAYQATAPITIKGKVSDENGQPLPGVSVSIKGTTKGTVTNITGNYVIEANEGDVLHFTFIGFAPTDITAGSATSYDVVLKEDSKSLSEVVVTALGIKKEKRAVGYATQEVSGASLEKAREPNVINSLTGKVAGLTVYSGSTLYETQPISLRGLPPLIVIDGIATKSDTYNLNADDIENITVLKGPAAALLYGGLGVNGALQITTKKGKTGTNGVEVTANITTQVKAGTVKPLNVQTEYGQGWQGQYAFVDGLGSGIYDNYGYVWGPKLNQKDPTTASGFVEIPQYNSPYDPAVNYNYTQGGNSVVTHYKPTPWISKGKNNLNDFLGTELLSTANVSIAGKSDKTDYRISVSQLFQKGQVPNTKINGTTLALAGGIKLNDKFRMDANFSYNRQYTPNYPQSGYGPSNYFYNILLWMGADADIKDMRNYWLPGQVGVRQLTYDYTWYNNPYFLANEYLRGYTNNVVVGQASATYDISKDLNFLVRSGGTITNTLSDLKTPYSFIDYGSSAAPTGNYSLTTNEYLRVVTDAILTYRKSFLTDFNATVRAGAADRYENTRGLSSSTVNGLQVPGVYNLANSNSPVTSTNSIIEKEVRSLYSTADISYKGFIYLNVSVRKDWTSALQVPYNSFFYPSASLSLVVSDMVRLPNVISYMKLRGAYSDIYNDNRVSPYQTLPIFSPGTRWNGTPSLMQPGTIYDPTLTPDRTRGPEYGLEMQFLNNRLGFDATYYTYKNDHSIQNVPVSQASGYQTLVVNSDVYNARGFELVLTGTPIKSKDFKWDIITNYSQVRNYVKELYGGADKRGLIKVGDRINVNWQQEGYNFTGYAWQKSPDGKIVYQNGAPQYINQEVVLGLTDPDWVFGITNRFNYKQFSFSFTVDGRIGGKTFDGVEAKTYEGGNNPNTANQYRDDAYQNKNTYVGDGVVQTGGEVTYDFQGKITSDTRTFAPNTEGTNYINWVLSYYSNGVTESNLYNRTFVKLREAVITYNLPKKLTAKTFIKDASISVVGRNLLLFTKVPYQDPDGYTGTLLAEPSYRNIGLNLNLKF